MKRITKKAWFGSRKVGWGLSPSSWEGWLATLVFIVLLLLDVFLLKGFEEFGAVVLGILFVIFTILKSGKRESDS